MGFWQISSVGRAYRAAEPRLGPRWLPEPSGHCFVWDLEPKDHQGHKDCVPCEVELIGKSFLKAHNPSHSTEPAGFPSSTEVWDVHCSSESPGGALQIYRCSGLTQSCRPSGRRRLCKPVSMCHHHQTLHLPIRAGG